MCSILSYNMCFIVNCMYADELLCSNLKKRLSIYLSYKFILLNFSRLTIIMKPVMDSTVLLVFIDSSPHCSKDINSKSNVERFVLINVICIKFWRAAIYHVCLYLSRILAQHDELTHILEGAALRDVVKLHFFYTYFLFKNTPPYLVSISILYDW